MKKRPLVQASLATAFACAGGDSLGPHQQPPPPKKIKSPPSPAGCCTAKSPAAANYNNDNDDVTERMVLDQEEASINKTIALAAALESPNPQNHRPIKTKTIVYCDLDGVLVDFNAGVESLFGGRRVQDVVVNSNNRELWARIGSANQFWSRLQWTRDGEELWNFLVNLWLPPLPVLNAADEKQPNDKNDNNERRQRHPVISELRILTGVSRQKGVGRQKYNWCKRELNVECQHYDMAAPKSGHRRINKNNAASRTNDENSNAFMKNKNNDNEGAKPPPPPRVIRVITCWSKNKHYESGPGRILIDDRADLRSNWEAKGGIFILHTSTSNTLEQLKQLFGLVGQQKLSSSFNDTCASSQMQADDKVICEWDRGVL